jgi:hypothetical protein
MVTQDTEKNFQNLIKGMDIPKFRKEDYVWLYKNLATRNQSHPNYEESNKVLIEILKGKSLITKSKSKTIN